MKMAVINTANAIGQFDFAIPTPTEANDKPITIITGPTTTEGNIFSITFNPHIFTIKDTTPYTKPTAIRPPNVPGYPYNSVAATIGAIKAKLLPKKIGTFPLVIT